MADRHILYKLLPFVQGAKIANAADIEVDEAGLVNFSPEDSQAVAARLDNLISEVATIEVPASTRPFVLFNDPVLITSANFATYANRNAIYGAARDKNVNFGLPQADDIPSGQYPVSFEVSHFGGTQRIEDTQNPNNSVQVAAFGADRIIFGQQTLGSLRLFRGDVAVFTRESAIGNYTAVVARMDPRSSILPQGAFRLRPQVIGPDATLANLVGFGNAAVAEGDAYELSVDIDTFGPAGVRDGDVLVAKQDTPSLTIDANNDDWIVLRDTQNFPLTIQEIRFLETVSETDVRAGVRQLATPYFWIMDNIPTTAPLVADGQQGTYTAASDELDRALVVAVPIGEDVNELILRIGRAGLGVNNEDFNFVDVFTDLSATIPPGTEGRYYLFGPTVDGFTNTRLFQGNTLTIQERAFNRTFTLSDAVDVTQNVDDIDFSQLSDELQTRIAGAHALTEVQVAKLAGLIASTTTTPFADTDRYWWKPGDPSTSISDYRSLAIANGIVPGFSAETVTILIPHGHTLTNLERETDSSITNDVTDLGRVHIGGTDYEMYTSRLPAVPDSADLLDHVWVLNGGTSNSALTGAIDNFKVGRNNLSDALNTYLQGLEHPTPSPYSLPDNLRNFSRHLTVENDETSSWEEISPSPIRATFTREVAMCWDEDRRTFTGNYFDDITGVTISGFQGNNIFFYNSPNDENNREFPGAQSYILNSSVRFQNTTGNTPIDPSFRKIIAFDYAIDFAPLQSGANEPMVLLGSSSTPLIGLSEAEGLYINLGRQDGGTRSRTRNVILTVLGGQWHAQVDEIESAFAEVIIPNNLTGSLTVEIEVQLDNNGNDAGTHVESYTITNVDADQNFGNRDYEYTDVTGPGTGATTREIGVTYEHENNDQSSARRVLFLRPTQPFTNAAFTWNIRATRELTETWNVPSTYARQPINAGDAHDDFGAFDPHRYTTEQLRARNRVLISIQKFREDDTESDPEMALRVVVDGETEGGSNTLIRTYRPASEFVFNDIALGNNLVGIAHIQVYAYDVAPPSDAEMQRLYSNGANWLGAFYPPGQEVDIAVIDSNLELTAGHSFILTDATTGNRVQIELDNGAFTFTTLP